LLERASLPDFWASSDAQGVTQKLSYLQDKLDQWQKMESAYEELVILAELIGESDDEELLAEFYEKASRLQREIESVEMELLLDEEYDKSNAILTVHAGAGGLDAQDWAEMLFRMYLRWAERHGYETQVIDALPDEEAGINSAYIYARLGETAGLFVIALSEGYHIKDIAKTAKLTPGEVRTTVIKAVRRAQMLNLLPVFDDPMSQVVNFVVS